MRRSPSPWTTPSGAGLLPGPHRNPFDRMLVAQTLMPLVSVDAVFDGYGVNRLWWSDSGPPKNAAEKAANRFAGAFLMPAEALWSEVGKRRTSIGWGELFELKQLFGVSVQALTYRCKDLGIISQALFRRLFNEFDRQGWRHPPYKEPFAMEQGEKPKRFERLCLRALAEGAVSESKAAELLGISVRELDRRMQEPPECESG